MGGETERALSAIDRRRYHRQILLGEVGPQGQAKLLASSVMLVGLGGLGAPCATYLAAAGVGQLTLVDHDAVELSNLHRQILFAESSVGQSKTGAAAERLNALNSSIRLQVIDQRADDKNMLGLAEGHNVVVDCTDNFRTRFAINDACAVLNIPLVSASVMQFEAQLSVFCGPDGPCYRCLYPSPPPPELAPNCADAGVIGVLPGILGTYQASETLKLLLGIGEPLIGRLAVFDILRNRFATYPVERRLDCPACSGHRSTAMMSGEPTATEEDHIVDCVSASQLAKLILENPDLQLIDVRSAEERESLGGLQNDIAIPLPQLEENVHRLFKDRAIICYCVSGARSEVAARMLMKNGFTDVRSLEKGILGWAGPTSITGSPD